MHLFTKLFSALLACCLFIAAHAQGSGIAIDSLKVQSKKIVLYTSDGKTIAQSLRFKDGSYTARYKKVDFVVNFDSITTNSTAQKLAAEAREQYRPRYKEPMVNTAATIVYDTENVYWINTPGNAGAQIYEEQLNKAKAPKLLVNEKKTYRITVVRTR